MTSYRTTGRLVGRDCPLCGGPGEPRGECEGTLLRECCGVLLAWPWETRAEYEQRYESEAAEYHEAEMLRSSRKPFVLRDTEYLATAAERLRLLTRLYPAASSLLDVGAGTGAMVAQAGAWGFQASGVEPCPALVELARRQGRDVRRGTWRDVREEADIICLIDVLEHLVEPLEALRHLRGRLRLESGALVVEMPEYLGPGDWKRHVKPLEHPALYSHSAAEELFRRAGLRFDAVVRPVGASLGKIAYYLRAVP